MLDILSATHSCQDDVSAVQSWVASMYASQFSEFFDPVRDLQHRLSSRGNAGLTDEELETILVELPMKLFAASERLTEVQVGYDVVKLRNKSADHTPDDSILCAAYAALLARVDREYSYCRELIMSCKKLYDARRRTDATNPVSEVVPEAEDALPGYIPDGPVTLGVMENPTRLTKAYIKGGQS